MIYFIFIFVAAFLSLVRELDLGWVLEWLVNCDPLYYHCAIIFIIVWRVGMWFESSYYELKRLVVKIRSWIDQDDQETPQGGSSPNSGVKSQKGSSSRGYHTSSRSTTKVITASNKAPHLKQRGVTTGKLFAHFGRLPKAIAGNFNAMLGVKARPLMAKVIRSMALVSRVSFTNSKFAAVVLISNRLAYLRRTMGLKGLTLYLKAAWTLFQQSLGGHILTDTATISKIRISRTNRGLPRLIPRQLRYGVRRGHAGIMRFVASILNLYREIEFPGVPKMNTIVDKCSGKLETVPSLVQLMSSFIPLFTKDRSALDYMEGGFPLFLIWKAAPGMIKDVAFGASNYSTHPHNVLKSLLALFNNPKLWDSFIDIAVIINHKVILQLVDLATKLGILQRNPAYKGALGKLHAKEEPAGKVRIFAMADCWTQWVLFPLHKFILSCLRYIPQDGTFDQTAPLERLLEKKPKELFSLDLTAATDRLPLSIQISLVTLLIGEGFAKAWANLLVGRTYGFFQLGYSKWHGSYRYGTGQPMGAYSSWAMLALTHHFIVQASAWRAGVVPVGTWFADYAVLGDDLVLANKAVADEYLEILRDLGMEVNLSKSLLSSDGTCLEFAKRTIFVYPDKSWIDISPVPIKEMAAAQGLLPALVQFGIKYQLTLPQLLASFGFGWRNLSWLSKPLGELPAQVRTIVLGIAIPKSAEELFGFFNLGARRLAKYTNDLVQIGIDFKHMAIATFAPKVAAKVAAAEAVLSSKDSLVMEMSKTWLERYLGLTNPLYRACQELGWSELHLSEEAQAFLASQSDDTITPDELADFLGSKAAAKAHLDAKAMTPQERQDYVTSQETEAATLVEALVEWYGALWAVLYGPAIDSYLEVVRDACFNIEAMGGKHRGSSMLVLTSFVNKENKESYGFFHRYFDFISTLEELAKASPAVLSFERPEGSEGIAQSLNAVTPIHLRYYRLWSGVIQGMVPLTGIGLNIRRPPAGLLPSETAKIWEMEHPSEQDDEDGY